MIKLSNKNKFSIKVDRYSFEQTQKLLMDNGIYWCMKNYKDVIISFEKVIQMIAMNSSSCYENAKYFFIEYDDKYFLGFHMSLTNTYDIILDATRSNKIKKLL